MRVVALFLCEAGTIRDSLLHVIGGAVSRLGRPGFPAPLGCATVMIVAGSPEELSVAHVIEVTLDHNDERVGGLRLEAQNNNEAPLREDEEGYWSFVLPTQGLSLPESGIYTLSGLVDGETLQHIRFLAAPTTAFVSPTSGVVKLTDEALSSSRDTV